MHLLEALVFCAAAFVIAVACVGVLFWLLRDMIFQYLDELDLMANRMRSSPKNLPADQRGQIEIARALTAVALAIVSAAKTLLFGLIMLAMALAVVG